MEMMVMGDITLIKDVVCPFCGSNCDDIEVEVQDNKILNVYNACSVGASVFMPIKGVKRFTKPLWRENKTDEFKEISWEQAFDKFAEIMINAKKTTIFWLVRRERRSNQAGYKNYRDHTRNYRQSNYTLSWSFTSSNPNGWISELYTWRY